MRRAGGRGRGRRHGPFVSPGPAAHAGRRAEGGRDGREGGPEPTRRALFSGPCGCRRAGGAGCRTPGHDDRMTPPSLCFLSWRAGSPPPEAASRGPLELRRSPPLPSPGPARAAGRPPPAPHHSPCGGQEGRSRARARRRRGEAGPGPPGGASRAPRSGRLGPGAGRKRRWRCRRRGVLLCSCSGTERGRDTPEPGKWEEGSEEGGQRRRRREDRRPRRLTLLAALARRHLTPPPAAGWADSEGDRDASREAWAPRGPAGGALRRLSYGREVARLPGRERASSPDAHRSALRPTDALSPPGTRAARERGRRGGVCASAKTPTAAAAGSAVTSRARRPAPSGPVPESRRRGQVRPCCRRAEPSHWRGCRPQGGAGRSESCGEYVSIFNPIVRPQPSSFRFSRSSPLLAIRVLTLCLQPLADISLSSLLP